MTTTAGMLETSDMLLIWNEIKSVAPKAIAATVVICEQDKSTGAVVYRSFTFPQVEAK